MSHKFKWRYFTTQTLYVMADRESLLRDGNRQPLLTRSGGHQSRLFSGMMIAVLVAGQVAQGLSIPLWYMRLPADSCIDIFVTFLVMIVWYPVMFFVTAVVAHAAQGRAPLAFLSKYDVSDHVLIVKTGLCDALNGALVIPASPSTRVPPVVGALIGCTTLLPLIVIKHVYLGVSLSASWVHYKSGKFLLVLLLYGAAAYTIVYPTVLHNEHIGHQVWALPLNATVLCSCVIFSGAMVAHFLCGFVFWSVLQRAAGKVFQVCSNNNA